MKVSCGWESVEAVLAEPNIRDLLHAYWSELWRHPEIPVDPDFDGMIAANRHGALRVWVARVDDTLAGFILWFVRSHHLAKSTILAIDGGHFVHPTFRGKDRIGYKLWRTAEIALREDGVRLACAHDNMAHPLMPFFLSLGWEVSGMNYHKVL